MTLKDLPELPEFLKNYLSGAVDPWASLCILLILGGTAAHDAYQGRVPNRPIFIGVAIIAALIFLHGAWNDTLYYIGWAVAFAGGLWIVNEVWYRVGKRDAIGMGDAKWSLLAAMTFGIWPLIWAWFIGSWLALCWMGGVRASGRMIKHVHFAPFLFFGLLIALYLRTVVVKDS